MTSPTLSICIPTYSRSEYLSELLDSIVSQGFPNIEVVIGDDASPDDTTKVVSSYLHKLPNIKYKRHELNIGLDLNFLDVIAEASSEYAWLMGDDDRLEPDAIRKVLAALEAWPGVAGLTLGVIDYDRDMKTATGLKSIPPTGELHGIETVFGSIVDLLGFMSTLVVNRKMWLAVCEEEPVMDFRNYYIQVYIVGRMIGRFTCWGVLSDRCVGYRSDNDQFLSSLGWVQRLRVDVVAYDQLASALLAGRPRAQRAMRSRILKTHIISRIQNAKTSQTPTGGTLEALKIILKYYTGLPELWFVAIPTLLAPRWLLRVARTLYKRYSASSGSQKATRLLRVEMPNKEI